MPVLYNADMSAQQAPGTLEIPVWPGACRASQLSSAQLLRQKFQNLVPRRVSKP